MTVVTDRVIATIETYANTAGIEKAQAGFAGLNLSSLALGAALGGLILVGKSAIENTEAQDKAHQSLAQAVAATNDQYGKTTTVTADTSKESAKLASAQEALTRMELSLKGVHKETALQAYDLAKAHKAVTDAQAELTAKQKESKTTMENTFIVLDSLQKEFDTWAETNKRYIPDQYAAEQALAAFVRAGATAPEAMRELNDSLDLATIKGTDMATSQNTITLALAGNAKGLKSLGITTEEYKAAVASATTAEGQHAAVLALIEAKTKDGRKAQTDLTQSTQALNKDWQDITTKVGPPLIGLFTTLVGWVDDLVNALNNLGNNKDWNKWLYEGLGKVQDLIISIVGYVQYLIQGFKDIGNFLGSTSVPSQASGTPGRYARAGGGPVSAGGTYLVGERGPETLVMGSGSGSIIPHGAGGGNVTINLYATVADGPALDRFTNQIAQRLVAVYGL